MAKVETTLKLNDEMSKNLKKIIEEMKKVESATSKVEEASEKMSNTSKTSSGIIKNAINGISKTINNLKSKINEVGSVWSVAFGSLAAQGIQKIGESLTSLVSTGVNFNKDMETYTTNFATMLGGSVDLAKEKVKELQTFAAQTPLSMSDLAQGTQTLLAFGVESEYTTSVLKAMGDVALGNRDKFASLTRVFGQVSAQGRLSMEDVNVMIDAGFNPLINIAEKTGQSMAELRESVSNGAVSFDMLVGAFQDATSEGGKFFNGMASASQTFAGTTSTLKDNVASLLGTLFQPLTDGLKVLSQGLITAIGVIQPIVQGFTNFIAEHMQAIQVILLIVGAVAVGFAIKWAIAWMIANAQTLLVIGLIVGGIYLLIKVLDFFGINVETVLGFVGGVFGFVFAGINNAIYLVMSVILGFTTTVYNVFIDFGNFIANVFENPISSVINLFANLSLTVLNILEKIASGIDFVFGSNLAGTVQNWKGTVEQARDDLINKFAKDENYEEKFKKLDLKPEDYGVKMMDIGESWNKGKSIGQNLGKGLNNFVNGIDDLAGGLNTTKGLGDSKGLEDLMKGTTPTGMEGLSGIDKGIKGVNDKLSGKGSLKSVGETKIKDENLKYLQDIAQARYQQAYQQTTPQVNINISTGDIKSGMDENRLFSKFENIVVDALGNNLAGGQ